ncbi:putative ORF3 protein [Giant panda associated gemycircularvirus]|uniref:Putative ORF3 protein n=1 Tax=Giant panda associated gemycircularvirus TaxID=2016461 RepID=A0A220IGQ6_9VIRU|nr:putative ORF3 protein [Giant panda associated gemycircularvirus]ASH99174.1 putative ORF3 protein [Giant panda associated gemycircularvirus]ASH99180.1 putative ORF3 protein [Giant panda associated gemycircularvirus]
MPDMPSSLMLNAMDWIPGTLSVICHHWELSVSSAERRMLMEVLITTLSPILERKENLDEQTALMCQITTQTSALLEVLLEKDTTMLLKTVISWEDLSPDQELEQANVHRMRSLLSSLTAKTSEAFGSLLNEWLQKHCFATFQASNSTQRGGIHHSPPSTGHRAAFILKQKAFLNSLNGDLTTLGAWNLE